jgi:hypothetical protein
VVVVAAAEAAVLTGLSLVAFISSSSTITQAPVILYLPAASNKD